MHHSASSNIPILALIPAWNEATRIGPIVEATRAYLPVLVVDNDSSDETPAVAEANGAKVLSHSQNQGKGVALMTGFAWALGQGYEAVLTLDADGQHNPADILKFLAAHEDDAGDLIIGRRDFDKMPFPRSWANPFGSWLLSTALDTRIYDNQSGYRLHSRRLLETLELTTTGFELEVEVIVQAVCQGIRISWVDIETIYLCRRKGELLSPDKRLFSLFPDDVVGATAMGCRKEPHIPEPSEPKPHFSGLDGRTIMKTRITLSAVTIVIIITVSACCPAQPLEPTLTPAPTHAPPHPRTHPHAGANRHTAAGAHHPARRGVSRQSHRWPQP